MPKGPEYNRRYEDPSFFKKEEEDEASEVEANLKDLLSSAGHIYPDRIAVATEMDNKKIEEGVRKLKPLLENLEDIIDSKKSGTASRNSIRKMRILIEALNDEIKEASDRPAIW